jgi:folate-binding protein YgfZ
MNLPVSTPPRGTVLLADWGVIRASGADAATFLHGQLTQDTQHLAVGASTLAGYCSAKGRLLASFVVQRPAADEFLLCCSADLLPAVLKRLSMFVLRAKCKLSDASAELPLWGLAGPASLAPGAVRLPDALVDGMAQARALQIGGSTPDAPAMALDDWRWLEVHSGVARIVAATAEQFVPQMVNLELVGGVNFQKGCYPGQEVVARSQYRGTLKRRAYVLHGTQAPSFAFAPGMEIFDEADPGQPAGMVVLAAVGRRGEHAALAELKIAAAAGGRLHAGAADGPALRLAVLPYALATEAA